MISVGFSDKLKKCNEEKDKIPKNIMDGLEKQFETSTFTEE